MSEIFAVLAKTSKRSLLRRGAVGYDFATLAADAWINGKLISAAKKITFDDVLAVGGAVPKKTDTFGALSEAEARRTAPMRGLPARQAVFGEGERLKSTADDVLNAAENHKDFSIAKSGESGIIKFKSKGKVIYSEKLLNSGNQLDKGGDLTKAGRALAKHGSRPGSIFPQATGNVANKNTLGYQTLKSILDNPNAVSVTRHHARYGDILEIKIPNGMGVRFTADGETFIGFLE